MDWKRLLNPELKPLDLAQIHEKNKTNVGEICVRPCRSCVKFGMIQNSLDVPVCVALDIG